MKVYAVVLIEESFFGKVSRVNTQRPYSVGDNESETRHKLETQFPDAWIVIGPKEFLMSGGVDLLEEDFEADPLMASVIAPVTLEFEIQIEDEEVFEICEAPFYDISKEKMILEDYPNSETAKFILNTRKEIMENGLKGLSGANFEKGDVPFTFLRQRKNSTNTYERLAYEVNQMMEAVARGDCKTFTFDDATVL